LSESAAERFAQGVKRPRSPVLEAREAMRQQLLTRTAESLAARGITRIALFGAGRHTRPIVRQPWVMFGVHVEVILDDAPRSSVLGGVRVARAGAGPLPAGVGAIVISSESYEHQLYERAMALYRDVGIPIITLYSRDDEAYESGATLERLMSTAGLSAADARWLVENRGERHDATLAMLPPARTELHLRRYELAADLLASRGGRDVADLACGTGYGSSLLCTSAQTRYHGMDIDARTIEYANSRHGGANRMFYRADATSTPLAAASVDLVASFETIEHIVDTKALVAEYARVLRPDGLLVVSTPNKLGPTPHHVHDFGLAEFIAALSQDFEVVEVLGQLPVDDVFAEDLPPGMWRAERAGGPLTAPDGSERKADYLIAIARPRVARWPAARTPSPTRTLTLTLPPPAADEVDIMTAHGAIRFFCPNDATRWRAETLSSKEPETLDWIDRFDAGDVFWDIGASSGPYTMYAAAAGRASTIVAFEPSPWNAWVIAEQLRRAGLSERVGCYSIAVSDGLGAGPLHMRHPLPAGAGSSFGSPVGEFGETFEPVFEQASIGLSIDELAWRLGVPFPNRIKIDVDGAEERIVLGATRTLADPRLKSVTIELDASRPDLIARITERMSAGGMRFVAKRHAAFVDDSPTASIFNFEFSRPIAEGAPR
jgi:FkbM family methyltransferase